MRQCAVSLLLLCLLALCASARAHEQVLHLMGRSTAVGYAPELSEADTQWLHQRSKLIVGVALPSLPPFEIMNNNNDYEGLVSDYLGLLQKLLGVAFEVRRFDSRAAATMALKDGTIDLLTMAEDDGEQEATLVYTTAYAESGLALVSRERNIDPRDSFAGKRLALVQGSTEPLAELYPQAAPQFYPSNSAAISAVAFGEADVFLGNEMSASYLINKNYVRDLHLQALADAPQRRFAFAVNTQDRRLLKLLNTALAIIPLNERVSILRRWNANGDALPKRFFLDSLTGPERLWLARHPRLKVAAFDNMTPVSFKNDQGEFRGIAADILEKITKRTGLLFDVEFNNTITELQGKLSAGQVDMLAAYVKSNEREKLFRFTRPYLVEPMVLATAMGNGGGSLEEVIGDKPLAVSKYSVQSEFISEHYPNINLVYVENFAESLKVVADGIAGANVGPMLVMRFRVAQFYREQLHVVGIVDRLWSETSLVTGRDNLTLYSILDKALLSITPEEMDDITNRWHGDVILGDSYWARNRQTISRFMGIGAVLLLLILAWAIYLSRLISKRKQAERALNEQMAFMRVLIDGTPHPIYVRDHQGRLLICNTAYLQVFGVTREQVLGRTSNEGWAPHLQEAEDVHQLYQQVMVRNEAFVGDRTLTLGPGRVFTVHHWIFPYHNRSGAVIGIISGWIDISSRQQLLGELQTAKEAADLANRAKTSFLTVMSHEIRTPMNAVIGMLELMLKRADPEATERVSMEVALGAAGELQNLVGDVLDIARIESGRLSLTPERVGLRALVDAVMRMLEGSARDKGLLLSLVFDPEADYEVSLDPLRFKQILSNLLGNAIKFTDEGKVSLIVKTQPCVEEGLLELSLWVQDTGLGISEVDQQRLFSPFVQASNNLQSARSGSGLGLVISRNLCEMMGGTLLLESQLGQGTVVKVLLELPLYVPGQPQEQTVFEPVQPSRSLRILVVDDYAVNRLLLVQQLDYLGHHAEQAEDGAQGLQRWREGGFDVVITDCNMPIMLGSELARIIRLEEQQLGLPRCLILGFTASAQPEEKAACLVAGMDDCLFKPVRLEHLAKRLGTPLDEPLPAEQVASAALLQERLDLDNLRRVARGDETSLRILLSELARNNQSDLVALAQLSREDDRKGLAALAHKISGGARIINLASLIDGCEQLEAACLNADQQGLAAAVQAQEQAMHCLGDLLARELS